MKTKSEAPFIGGVNRQALAYRPAPGITDAENVDFSPLRGASKRAPSRHVAELTNASGFDKTKETGVYFWEHRSGTRYGVLLQSGSTPVVFDADTGSQKTVTLKSGTANYNYLPGLGFDSAVRFVPAGDKLLILNTLKEPALANSAEAAKATTGECLIHVARANYERTYRIEIDTSGGNGAASVTTVAAGVAGGVPPAAIAISTQNIATYLAAAITAALAAPTGGAVTATAVGATIRMTGNFSTVRAVRASDNDGGNAMTVMWNTVVGPDKLPKIGYHGYRVKVSGVGESTADDYYVKFVADDATNAPFGEGQWEECPPHELENALDATTMPHALELTTSGNFEFAKQTWTNRLVGDNDTNPFPSFIRGLNGAAPTYAAHVGVPITDAFFANNRLWLLAADSVVASEAGDPFNLMRTTTRSLPDSDRIDLQETSATRFNGGVFDNDVLVLFSRAGVYALTFGGGYPSPKSANMQKVASVESDFDNGAYPAANGRSVFVAQSRNTNGSLQELLRVGDGTRYESFDASAALPDWIGRVRRVESHMGSDAVFVADISDTDVIYVHRYLWVGGEKRAQSWTAWRFSGDIEGFGAIGSTLYLVEKHTDGYYLSHVDLTLDENDTGSDFRLCIDRRLPLSSGSLTKTYDGTTNQTTITLPYEIETGDVLAVVSTDGSAFTTVAQSSGPGANAFVRVRGDKSAVTGYVGVTYTAYVLIDRPIFRESSGYGSMDPPAMVLDCVVQYDKSGPFTVQVTSTDGRSFESNFDSPLGSYAAAVGEAVPLTGSWRFPVRLLETEASVRIQSTSAVPFAIQGVSWTHREFARGRGRR